MILIIGTVLLLQYAIQKTYTSLNTADVDGNACSNARIIALFCKLAWMETEEDITLPKNKSQTNTLANHMNVASDWLW